MNMRFMPKRYDIDDFFDDFIPSVDRFSKSNQMKCDIYEKDGKYNIEMDIPGYDKKDISIEVDNDVLTVTASKEKEENDESKNYIRRERYYGTFFTIIPLLLSLLFAIYLPPVFVVLCLIYIF